MEKTYDLIIVGAGPSALTAAIYAAREDIKTLLIEKGIIGGFLATIDNIENYPGFPNGIEGLTLAEEFQKQAEKFGAQIEMFTTVEKLSKKSDDTFEITTDNGVFTSRAVLIASGSSHRKLGIPNEEMVNYCATCDGAVFRGKRLVVVGGGNSAIQEAIFLTKFADHIDILARDGITASEILQKKLAKCVADGKIDTHENTPPDEVLVEGGKVVGVKSGKKTFDCDGVFVFAGIVPNTGFLDGSGVELDKTGHIITRTNHELMTNIDGIFASGDVRSGATKQVASAVGEGVTAAIAIREFLNKRQ